MRTIKTILATAYAVNPYKGSEDGMGWNFIIQIARFNKVIAITRENNQPSIEKYMSENPNEVYQNIQFLYFDLPYWMRFWKKGSRGAMLYYWLWQLGIVSFIKKQNIAFDIAHNVNFHNDWTPSYLWKLGKPFVWGPIGHHPLIPKQYLEPYKKSYFIKDRLTWVVKKYFWNFSNSLRHTSNKAAFILGMNHSVATVLKINKERFAIMPSVATEDFGCQKRKDNSQFTLISAGRLVPLKGFDLSILAFADFIKQTQCINNVKLVIVGSGPEQEFLQKLVQEKNIQTQVQFIHWIDRMDLMKLFKESSAFLFPSHEGAGMVVAEALSFGLPVVCLDNCGPGEFINDKCGFAVEMQDYEKTIKSLSDKILTLYQNPELLQQMQQSARTQFETIFHWNRRGEQLRDIYQQL